MLRNSANNCAKVWTRSELERVRTQKAICVCSPMQKSAHYLLVYRTISTYPSGSTATLYYICWGTTLIVTRYSLVSRTFPCQ